MSEQGSKIHRPRFTCSKHGDQGIHVGVEISVVQNPLWPLPAGLEPYAGVRRYCMACYIDLLDANLEQVVELGGASA